jgi:peroxiredoxin
MEAPNFAATAIGGRRVDLKALRGRTVLLKFYRFATCPVCNWHMHGFIHDYPQVEALGLTTVVLYHSPADKVSKANPIQAPFDIVADPAKKIFNAYGVERSWRGMFSPAVMRTYIKALKAGYPAGILTSDGGITGNPADFLIDANGRIAYVHYGKHYADTLDAPQIVELRRGLENGQARPAFPAGAVGMATAR